MSQRPIGYNEDMDRRATMLNEVVRMYTSADSPESYMRANELYLSAIEGISIKSENEGPFKNWGSDAAPAEAVYDSIIGLLSIPDLFIAIMGLIVSILLDAADWIEEYASDTGKEFGKVGLKAAWEDAKKTRNYRKFAEYFIRLMKKNKRVAQSTKNILCQSAKVLKVLAAPLVFVNITFTSSKAGLEDEFGYMYELTRLAAQQAGFQAFSRIFETKLSLPKMDVLKEDMVPVMRPR